MIITFSMKLHVESMILGISVSDQSRLSFSCSSLSGFSFTASTPMKKSFTGSSIDNLVWIGGWIFAYLGLLVCTVRIYFKNLSAFNGIMASGRFWNCRKVFIQKVLSKNAKFEARNPHYANIWGQNLQLSVGILSEICNVHRKVAIFCLSYFFNPRCCHCMH